MAILDKTIPVCSYCCFSCSKSATATTTTIGDLFKLVIPLGWTIVAGAACLAYLIAPLSRGDSPRWGSAALVVFSAVAGIGLSMAIYSFHRKTSSFAIEETFINEEQIQFRRRTLRIHGILSSCFSILSTILAIFFGIFASDMDRCAHETCGADVSWSCITLVVSMLWMGVTYLGYRHLLLLVVLLGKNHRDNDDNADNDDDDEELELP